MPFNPTSVRSHFQHVFIIVKANNPCTDHVSYTFVLHFYTITDSLITFRMSVCRARDVPAFGPPLPPGGTCAKSQALRDFLLAKIINAGERVSVKAMS